MSNGKWKTNLGGEMNLLIAMMLYCQNVEPMFKTACTNRALKIYEEKFKQNSWSNFDQIFFEFTRGKK